MSEGFTTKSIHTRYTRKDPHGALNMPVYDSVAFEFDSAEAIADAFQGKTYAHVYSRISNPTVEHLENKVKQLTGAIGVIATSTGMSALAAVFLAIAGAGENIITTKHIFGNTYSLLGSTLKDWGLEVRFADLSDPASIEALITNKTRAIFFETITNPQLEVADIKALAAVANKHGLLLIADTTITPPYLLDSTAHGIHLEVLSSTKYISGGATSLGGLIIDNGNYNWQQHPRYAESAKALGPYALYSKLKRRIARDLGISLAPHNAYLQTLGLDTLALRADKSCSSTLAIAQFLTRHPKVTRVNYPGLPSSKAYTLSQSQFPHGAGAVLTFEVESKVHAFKLINQLRLIRRATNLNDNKTLIVHPASTIFSEYSDEILQNLGVPQTLIRLAVGIEDTIDLIQDLNQGLELL